ncbi:MAG: FmdB family transcriptional regulator [Microbacteriaceae bacterium]|nr:FmdB family transcriptional regulator [Microbacteriaceae bacterium]
MPTYSYRCTECSKAFDVQQSFTDASLTVCPSCSGVLRKVFSPVGVSFTGSGFYRNDSRAKPETGKGKNASESSGKPSEKSAEKSSEKSSEKSGTKESKPASTRSKEPSSAATSSGGNAKPTGSKSTT